MAKKSITVLGSTGSIGKSTVDILKRYPDLYEVKALTGYQNVTLLAEQAKLLNAEIAVTADENKYLELKELLLGTNIKVLAGSDEVCAVAGEKVDWTMSCVVGAAGLLPTMQAIKNGQTVALANKETLVCAGDIVMKAIKDTNTTLVPVDSEHSAIFQTLETPHRASVDRILLTASGGPFRQKDLEFMKSVTPEQAVAHPNWSMGAKISVDSATMMNKGLEIIEAYHLFGYGTDKIEVLVHPQSIMHSGVGYSDGSVLAHLGMPDMRTPIAFALAYPNRMVSPTEKLDFTKMSGLTFSHPDEEKFPALRLAKECLNKGQTATAVMNAANEVAVDAFLNRKIGFLDIVSSVEDVVSKHSLPTLTTIEDVIEVDKEARLQTLACLKERIK